VSVNDEVMKSDRHAGSMRGTLVARLSMEPGIHDVHWHSADETDLAQALAASQDEE